MIPFLLLLLGLLFIFLEFYLPGTVMAILGTIMVVISVILFIQESNSPAAILIFMIGALSSIALLIKYTIWRIPKSKPEFSIYLKSDQEGFQASKYDASAIGKKGIVLADLKPGGYILVDDKKLQAISISGYIAKGEEVVVIGGQEESLIVKQIKLKSYLPVNE